MPADDTSEPNLVVWDADVPIAHETANVKQVRGYRFGVDDPVQVFRAAVDSCAPGAEVIGFDASSRAVPHALGNALTRLSLPLAASTAPDCSRRLASSGPPPSSSSCGGRARFAQAGLQAALDHARPAISERRLAAEIEVRDAQRRIRLSVEGDMSLAAVSVPDRRARWSACRSSARRSQPGSRSRWKSSPRWRELRRLKRNANSFRYACRCSVRRSPGGCRAATAGVATCAGSSLAERIVCVCS